MVWKYKKYYKDETTYKKLVSDVKNVSKNIIIKKFKEGNHIVIGISLEKLNTLNDRISAERQLSPIIQQYDETTLNEMSLTTIIKECVKKYKGKK